MSTKPQQQPAPSRTPGSDTPVQAPNCDEFSGGGGSATDTRHRGLPGNKEGDCAPVGHDLTPPESPKR